MYRDLTLAWICSLHFLVAPLGARADTYGITDPDVGSLSVVEGKAFLTHGPFFDSDWNLAVPTTNMMAVTTVITSKNRPWGGWALAYDPQGKGRAVVLARPDSKGDGEKWWVTKVSRKTYTIQAAEGKYKGWYLDVAGKEERFNDQGERYIAYRLILTEKPAKMLKFKINVISR